MSRTSAHVAIIGLFALVLSPIAFLLAQDKAPGKAATGKASATKAPATKTKAATTEEPVAKPPAPPAKEPTPLAKDLLGAWILVGTPGKVGEAPATGGRLKFCTGRHWMITQPDETTGVTIFHHGGTYTVDGDEYAETLHYAAESTKSMIGETNKFKIKIEGDTLTILGIGNPYNEVWKRMK